MKKVLVTCPPMIGQIDQFDEVFKAANWDVLAPKVAQILPEEELIELLPDFDGWIIGDDPATARVLRAGHAGRLRAAVKWGIGVDNVDFAAAEALGIKIVNTPAMFGAEVADLAMHYLVGLARQTYLIDRSIRQNQWPKPAGRSVREKNVALIGFGDIGRHFAKRAAAAEMQISVYDPAVGDAALVAPHKLCRWPDGISDCDFIVLTCALTSSSRKMINAESISMMRPGVQIVNVSRGGLIDEQALTAALESGQVQSAALDVFESEPLPSSSPLRKCDLCIFGSHNASNTIEAVNRASMEAIDKLSKFLAASTS